MLALQRDIALQAAASKVLVDVAQTNGLVGRRAEAASCIISRSLRVRARYVRMASSSRRSDALVWCSESLSCRKELLRCRKES